MDVTIAYPGGIPQLLGLHVRSSQEIKVRVRFLPIERNLVGITSMTPSSNKSFNSG